MAAQLDLHDAAEVPAQAQDRPVDAYGASARVDMEPSCVFRCGMVPLAKGAGGVTLPDLPRTAAGGVRVLHK
jgi:hypothetical protein